jgi:DNA helicase-4
VQWESAGRVSTRTLRGVRRGDGSRFVDAWHTLAHYEAVLAAEREFNELLSRDAYFNRRALVTWLSFIEPLLARIPHNADALVPSNGFAEAIRNCRRFRDSGETIRQDRNNDYVQQQRVRHPALLTAVGGEYGLTEEQSDAALRDEDNCLVVAGAGTGKTTTLIAKLRLLLRAGMGRRERILALTFARKAARELSDRLGPAAHDQIAVRTFHALGLEIIAQAEGKKPTISKLAEDRKARGALITRLLRESFDLPEFREDVSSFFAYHLFPLRRPHDFDTPHAHHTFVESHDLRTLCGERVKSNAELLIANWLFRNGIEYQYEPKYEHDVATVQYRQYQPDFFLPEYHVYIEHFGVDRDGRTAPGIDAEKYRAGMLWKQEVHQKYGTRLVTTYTWELESVEAFLKKLEQKLVECGVVLRPLSPDELRVAVERQLFVAPVAELFGTFLSLFKGNQWTLAELELSRLAIADRLRAEAFLRLFRHIYAQYEKALAENNEIDFDDMIGRASEHVREGTYQSSFSRVVVDEFQDISRGRARLLKALLAQVEDSRLFCVGDDWQSIYRFAGSDVGIMTSFEQEFGYAHRCHLTRTYRFNSELLSASSQFVQRNPAQIRKSLTAETDRGSPAVEVLTAKNGESNDDMLGRALAQISDDARRASGPKGTSMPRCPTVLVLGRYRRSLPTNRHEIEQAYAPLSFQWMTVHTAKGAEADYVVVLGATAGEYGFPSEIADDPLLGLVLSTPDPYPHAEERRVFYVALSRARRLCVVLTHSTQRSEFVSELEGPAFRNWVRSTDAGGADDSCGVCGGPLVLRTGRYGAFWACGHYPLCEGKARRCPTCGVGALVSDDRYFRCTRVGCDFEARLCPACGVGMLVPRKSKTGKSFLGCTEYRRRGQGPSCSYGIPMPNNGSS